MAKKIGREAQKKIWTGPRAGGCELFFFLRQPPADVLMLSYIGLITHGMTDRQTNKGERGDHCSQKIYVLASF